MVDYVITTYVNLSMLRYYFLIKLCIFIPQNTFISLRNVLERKFLFDKMQLLIHYGIYYDVTKRNSPKNFWTFNWWFPYDRILIKTFFLAHLCAKMCHFHTKNVLINTKILDTAKIKLAPVSYNRARFKLFFTPLSSILQKFC